MYGQTFLLYMQKMLDFLFFFSCRMPEYKEVLKKRQQLT